VLTVLVLLGAGIGLVLLESTSSDIAQQQARALVAELERPYSDDWFSKLLREFFPERGKARERNEVANEMAALGVEAVPEIITATRHRLPYVRLAAARALGRIGDRRAVTPLAELLARDSDSEVRGAAASSLGLLHDPRAVDALVSALGDKDETVQVIAAFALALQKRPEAVPALAEAITGENDWRAVYAVVGLALIGTPDARQALVVGAREAVDPAVRRLAARAQAMPVVAAMAEELREKDQTLHVYIIDAFEALRDPASLRVLEEALKSPRADVRYAARRAIRQIRRASQTQAPGAPPQN